jgi:DNA-binding transcriptional ArsR family regulator
VAPVKQRPSEVFRILGVDTRLKIIELLKSRGPLGVTAIADELDVTPSAISQHLRVLRQAGLVDRERRGYWVPYWIDEEGLGSCCGMLLDVCTCDCGAPHHRGSRETPKAQIEALTEYKRALKRRIADVERRIDELRKRK